MNGFIPPLPYTPIETHWDFIFFFFCFFHSVLLLLLLLLITLEPVTGRSVRTSPLQTNHFYKEGKESDNWVELKVSVLEIIEKCREAESSEVKSYLTWSVAKCNKVKWKKHSEVEWGEVKCSAV